MARTLQNPLPKIIISQYLKDELSLNDIAKIHLVSKSTVKRYLLKYNVKLRSMTLRENKTLCLFLNEEKITISESCLRRTVKKHLIKTSGHICSICSNTEWNGQPIPLICDHVDGNHNNTKINNFRLVCANCDYQLPTFKNKNNGRGRKYARAYYHSNKLNKS